MHENYYRASLESFKESYTHASIIVRNSYTPDTNLVFGLLTSDSTSCEDLECLLPRIPPLLPGQSHRVHVVVVKLPL